MRATRFYTQDGHDFCTDGDFNAVPQEDRLAPELVVPRSWNQAAVDILREKIFYPTALPAITRRMPEPGVPAWLWRSEADDAQIDGLSAEWRYHAEKDIRDVLHRMAGSLAYQGWKRGIFAAEEDAKIFYDEFRYILLHQIAAPELTQWRLLGLNWAYGLTDVPAYAPRLRDVVFDEHDAQALRRIKILGETLALDGAEKINAILPVENPASLDFINVKRNDDIRRVAEDLGCRVLETAARHVMDACHGGDRRQAVSTAQEAGLSAAAIQTAISYAEQGYEDISFAVPEDETTGGDFIRPVLSIPDGFIEAALTGHSFLSRPAPKLWAALGEAVWSSGAPAILFRNSCEAAVPEAAAPSATINLLACADIDALRHVTRVMLLALEVASESCSLSLGMTNMAATLMSKGIAYDSDAGRTTAALLAAFVSGAAYQVSAEMAGARGVFPAYRGNEKEYLQRIKDRLSALSGEPSAQKELLRRPLRLRTADCPDAALADAAKQMWEGVYKLGKESGFRHATLTAMETEMAVQVLLGAETQDIIPVAALFNGRQPSALVPQALTALGYAADAQADIFSYARGQGTLREAPHINHKTLRAKGFHQAALDALEAALATTLHIRYVFNKWTLGADFCRRVLGFTPALLDDGTFDMLPALGFTEEQIAAANAYCCGTLTLKEAPPLPSAHAAVFDCNVSPEAQIRMQTAVEPFLSGMVAHTVRLEQGVTIEKVQKLILMAWESGLKTLRLYRENGSLLAALPMPLAETSAEMIEENQPVQFKVSIK
jgi:ribonucleoside-diphosphate reductase alpha chain